jgi:hypothetical protein
MIVSLSKKRCQDASNSKSTAPDIRKQDLLGFAGAFEVPTHPASLFPTISLTDTTNQKALTPQRMVW